MSPLRSTLIEVVRARFGLEPVALDLQCLQSLIGIYHYIYKCNMLNRLPSDNYMHAHDNLLSNQSSSNKTTMIQSQDHLAFFLHSGILPQVIYNSH